MKCSGYCHDLTSRYLRRDREEISAATVLEDNYIFGKYYHSFVIKNGIIFDGAHNLIMRYEDYVRLINPKIIIYEDNNIILNNINKLETKKSFMESKCVDILKYAMEVQKKII